MTWKVSVLAVVLPWVAACDMIVGLDDVEDPALIDDLDDGDLAIARSRVGRWYVVNDETGGSQLPWPFAPTQGGVAESAYCAGTTGDGFTGWGAKLGVTLHQASANALPLAYDASSYDGIAFQARGSAVNVVVVTPGTLDAASGGECVPEGDRLCNAFHGQSVAASTGWLEHQVPFAALTQEIWGKPVDFDPARAVAIEFELDPGTSFDICIDDLRFYRDGQPR